MNIVGVLKCESTDGKKEAVILALNCFYFGMLFSCWITTSWYLVNDVQEALEYAEASYYAGTSTTILLLYIHIARTNSEFHELFGDLELMIEQSEREGMRTNICF